LREVKYKKYRIMATAERTLILAHWRATYEVRQQQRLVSQVTGTCPGPFNHCEEAEEAAIKAGKIWVDQQ